MYPYIELAVRPSIVLVRIHVFLHLLLFLSVFPFLDQRLIYCVPLWLVQTMLLLQLITKGFEFQRSGFWLYQNNQWHYGQNRNDLEAVEWMKVDRLLPFLTVVMFKLPHSKIQRQILVKDRVMAEPFRQFRVMLKKHQLESVHSH